MITPSPIATSPPAPISALEHPSGWLDFTTRVRTRVEALRWKATGTSIEQEVEILAKDARKLCDHVELLHRETHRWLSETGRPPSESEGATADLNSLDIQRAAVSIQREQHEQSRNPMDFIKALLMWVETPEEHVGNGVPTPLQQ